MRRTTAILTRILFVLGAVVMNGALAQSTGKRFFLLEDAEHHQWCAYGNESEWTSEVKSLTALMVATLEYSGDQVSKIAVTEEDEAGDWIVYDHYLIGDKGEIRELKRTINILPGDRSEEETYLVLDGKAKKQSSNSRKLSTKEVLPAQQEQKDWLPNVPIIPRLQDFPFAALISGKHLEPASSGKVCVPVKQPQSP
jgi:hypothetical protein